MHQAFHNAADMHTCTSSHAPGYNQLGSRGYPVHYSNTAENAQTENRSRTRIITQLTPLAKARRQLSVINPAPDG